MRLNTIDLRQAIITRVKNKSNEELTDIIQDSIGNDERTLPGLGVLFEMIWQDSTAEDQTRMIGSLYQRLNEKSMASEPSIGHS